MGPFLTAGLPLLKNVPKPLVKSILISLGLTAAASTTNAAILKKLFRTILELLLISNE